MTITHAVAERLSGILAQRKMLKKDFKEMPGINGQSINNIFRKASTASISMKTLYKICKALDMTMVEFLDDPVFDNIKLQEEEMEMN